MAKKEGKRDSAALEGGTGRLTQREEQESVFIFPLTLFFFSSFLFPSRYIYHSSLTFSVVLFSLSRVVMTRLFISIG